MRNTRQIYICSSEPTTTITASERCPRTWCLMDDFLILSLASQRLLEATNERTNDGARGALLDARNHTYTHVPQRYVYTREESKSHPIRSGLARPGRCQRVQSSVGRPTSQRGKWKMIGLRLAPGSRRAASVSFWNGTVVVGLLFRSPRTNRSV